MPPFSIQQFRSRRRNQCRIFLCPAAGFRSRTRSCGRRYHVAHELVLELIRRAIERCEGLPWHESREHFIASAGPWQKWHGAPEASVGYGTLGARLNCGQCRDADERHLVDQLQTESARRSTRRSRRATANAWASLMGERRRVVHRGSPGGRRRELHRERTLRARRRILSRRTCQELPFARLGGGADRRRAARGRPCAGLAASTGSEDRLRPVSRAFRTSR